MEKQLYKFLLILDKEMQDTSSESQGNKLTEVKVPKLLQNLVRIFLS